jgi:hypothetical protein
MEVITNSGVDYDVFGGLGVKIYLNEKEDFLKIKETLTRVGVLEGTTLNQTCYILHKKGEYAIMHHLEMRALDGYDVDLDAESTGHRNTVAYLLDNWGLLEVEDPRAISTPRAERGAVTVVAYKNKAQYQLRPLYEIGKIR